MLAFRLADWDTPLRVHPHRQAQRFNQTGDEAIQYACLHPLGPWAEHVRAHGLRSAEDLLEVRSRTWVLRFALTDVAELSFDGAERFGLDPAALVSDDWGACQDFADRCRAQPEMPKAFTTPSAALPGTRNLVVLGPQVAASYNIELIDEVDVAASITADGGRPLHTLLDLVRQFGDKHEELEAWRRGRHFDFAEPAWSLLDVPT